MNLATMLLLTASMTTLVLRTGDRIAVAGPVHDDNGVVVFRVLGGALYSIPESEVDLEATQIANASATDGAQPAPKPLKVSAAERDRLLKELEQNHTGVPAPPPRFDVAAPYVPAPVSDSEEWRWRREARSYEEAVRQAKENLDLLLDRADRLRSEISGLLSLGFKPDSFSLKTFQLESVQAQIPQAQLEVERAQRAYDLFRDDARRQGVMPGWLR